MNHMGILEGNCIIPLFVQLRKCVLCKYFELSFFLSIWCLCL
uniref:Uncharacterized protein n=1 Tax=Anguilla anguilla TaxID=7936 RepID=A0A0E9V2V7_ANGAN